MSAGNLIFLLVLIGGVVGMFLMHRGGGHAHGMGGGCGGHGHGHATSDDARTTEPPDKDKAAADVQGTHVHGREPATQGSGSRHSGC